MNTFQERKHSQQEDGDHAWARLALNCPNGPVTLIDQSGFRRAEVIDIGRTVAANLAPICQQWRRMHG